jgi:hypothetical protein
MTRFTIKNGAKLSRDTFEDWKDFHREYILMQESLKLTQSHKQILKQRETEADNIKESGMTWQQVKKSIKRNSV